MTAGEFFRWKHLAGPFGRSTLLVTEADGAVVGFAAYMPWRFRARGQIVTAMRGVDYAVHPAYQRLGSSMAIRDAAKFSSEIAFIWSNPNAQSRVGGLRSGRHQVAGLPHFVRPRGQLPKTILRARGKASRAPQRLSVSAERAGGILGEGASLTRLLERDVPGDRLATVKDLDYLRWRYGRFGDYWAVQTGADGEGKGLAIFRSRLHGRFSVSHVCELFVEPGGRRIVRRLLHRVAEAVGADFLSCGFSSRLQASRYGFVQYRGQTVLMTFPLKQCLVPDPTQRASWTLSLGDLELL